MMLFTLPNISIGLDIFQHNKPEMWVPSLSPDRHGDDKISGDGQKRCLIFFRLPNDIKIAGEKPLGFSQGRSRS